MDELVNELISKVEKEDERVSSVDLGDVLDVMATHNGRSVSEQVLHMFDESDNPVDQYGLLTQGTAKYPEAGEGTWLALSYVGLGLGEVGEIQGKLKKVLRDDKGVVTPERREALEAEIGDAFWYLVRLCYELDLLPSEVLRSNLVKLYDRKERGVIGGSGDNR